ncbi:MAG TPA: class I SAM-dependent methyltransferase [Gaiellaceae bacterium]
MTFDVSGDAYDTFIGRYGRELAPLFVDFAGIDAGTVLDVGCGSGILTEELASRLGAENVAAVDPSPLVDACAARVPGADVRRGVAEALPWPVGSFDAALSQLVLHFLDDPVAGLVEMRRVTRPGGIVAACSWNFDEMLLLRTFWRAARAVVPAAAAETLELPSLEAFAELGDRAGLADVEGAPLDVARTYEDFDELWDTFQLGVGPAGQFCVSLDPVSRSAIRDEYRRLIGEPDGSFELTAQAWALRGRVPT